MNNNHELEHGQFTIHVPGNPNWALVPDADRMNPPYDALIYLKVWFEEGNVDSTQLGPDL